MEVRHQASRELGPEAELAYRRRVQALEQEAWEVRVTPTVSAYALLAHGDRPAPTLHDLARECRQ
jgi:hypothetical protein